MISLENVQKTYEGTRGATQALAAVSFASKQGEFISLLGPSGCGKSTLLMLVAGLEPLTSGRIVVNGHLVEAPRKDVGIVFQDATLLPWRSALENVLFPIQMMRRPIDEYRDRAVGLLTEVGLGKALSKRPHELSGGMRQRVSICRALIHEPDILLMDEPFSALDAITRDQMNRLVSQLLQEHRKTVLLVTHSIREAVFLSDRVLVMGARPGRIITSERINFPHPRRVELEQDLEFIRLCVRLREAIETSLSDSLD